MNSVIDPSALLISSAEWQDADKRARFLNNLADNLRNIDEFKITKFYWTARLEDSLWKTPQMQPWRADVVRNRLIPIIRNRFSQCKQEMDIDDGLSGCKVFPALSCMHGKKEFDDSFMDLTSGW